MSSTLSPIRAWKVLFLGLCFILAALVIVRRLYVVQIEENTLYKGSQLRQSLRRVQVPGQRGRIFDRNGNCLADNRASYCIALYTEELRKPGNWSNTVNNVSAQIDALSEVLQLPRQLSYNQVNQHVRKRLPLPLIAWRDLDDAAIARFLEHQSRFAGADVLVQAERFYPYGKLAAHVIGYVGRSRPPEEEDSGKVWHYHGLEMRGRTGIEQYYDRLLSGGTGEEIIRVDARGYRYNHWINKTPHSGQDMTLTLDAGLQQVLEKQLDGKVGAGVVLNPRNGDVLALASSPAFDLNEMVPVLSTETWQRLNDDPGKVLFNRAVQGAYPPGSVFKPFTALAGLASGVPADWIYNCTGRYTMGNQALRCWNRYGHGELSLHMALAESCNPYFCAVAEHIGAEPIRTVARDAGFGAPTGIDLHFEASGLVPTESWKRANRGEAWYVGDTCQLSIGQGALTASPLQVAAAIGTLSMKGRMMKPRLYAGTEPRGVVVKDRLWNSRHMSDVISGMIDVVEIGTGRRVKLNNIQIAAKTGSAEYTAKGERKKHTWVAAFAPAGDPEIVVAIVIEDGQSGGLTTAPLVRSVLAAHFGEHAAEPPPRSLTGLEGMD